MDHFELPMTRLTHRRGVEGPEPIARCKHPFFLASRPGASPALNILHVHLSRDVPVSQPGSVPFPSLSDRPQHSAVPKAESESYPPTTENCLLSIQAIHVQELLSPRRLVKTLGTQ